MDLETENHLAALLMKEAGRLRREADKDGVHIYIQKPNVRGRPNSRFLTATVLGVEQANRAAEISEMWRARGKERELDAKLKHESKGNNSTGMHPRNGYLNEDSKLWLQECPASTTCLNKRHTINSSIHCSSSKRYSEDPYSSDDVGLQDDDIEEFLRSRVKRGRGSVGCRMDEPGPYLPSTSADLHEQLILGPEKPYSLKSNPSNDGVGHSMLQATNGCRSKNDRYEEKRKTKREKSESRRRKESSSKNQKKHRRRD